MKLEKKFANIAGYSLILMALVAGAVFGYAFTKFSEKNISVSIDIILQENTILYYLMLAGIFLIIILDFVVAWALYYYFKNENENIAKKSFIFRIIFAFIFLIAAYFLVINLGQNNPKIIQKNFELFDIIWSAGLIIFGIHLFLISILMKMHKYIPIILCYITMLAGISYILVHSLKIFFPQFIIFTNVLNDIFTLPMIVGELGLAFWLVIKGKK